MQRYVVKTKAMHFIFLFDSLTGIPEKLEADKNPCESNDKVQSWTFTLAK